MICCIKCGCPTFRQELTLKADVVYDLEFGDEGGAIGRKDLQDRDEYDHVQEKPFACKNCRTPLVDEQGNPLLKEAELAAWANRMEAVMVEVSEWYDRARRRR